MRLPCTSEKGALYGNRSVLYVGNIFHIAAVESKFLVQPESIMANNEFEYISTNKIGVPFTKGKKYD